MNTTLAAVERAIGEAADSFSVACTLLALPGFQRGCGVSYCQQCHGEPLYVSGISHAYDNRICLTYNPDRVTSQELWWVFCHELGHIAQARDNFAQNYSSAFDLHQRELDAWKRAEEVASLSEWPPTEEFYQLRRRCLDTYGIAA
jgi:hypothetical protein